MYAIVTCGDAPSGGVHRDGAVQPRRPVEDTAGAISCSNCLNRLDFEAG